jgi:hypothetical protein
VSLLAQHHAGGLRFEPQEAIAHGDRVALELAGTYKVFTFANDAVVLIEDCVDRDDALARLAGA